jgi:hypothetical protein
LGLRRPLLPAPRRRLDRGAAGRAGALVLMLLMLLTWLIVIGKLE